MTSWTLQLKLFITGRLHLSHKTGGHLGQMCVFFKTLEWSWSVFFSKSLTAGFPSPCFMHILELEKGGMPKFWGIRKSVFFMLSRGVFWLAWMRENTFSGVPRMHCNVANSSNNTDTYWLRRRPKYSSSYTWKKNQILSLTLIWTCQVERCQGNYAFCVSSL